MLSFSMAVICFHFQISKTRSQISALVLEQYMHRPSLVCYIYLASMPAIEDQLERKREKMEGVSASNKQVILRDYVSGTPKEDDMEVRTNEMKMEVPQGSKAVLVKNLYLSCDPYMRILMKSTTQSKYITSFKPGSASLSFTLFGSATNAETLGYGRKRMISSLTDFVNDNLADDVGCIAASYRVWGGQNCGFWAPEFEAGDLAWGKMKWEEYSLLIDPNILFKIARADVPLSCYTGILGK